MYKTFDPRCDVNEGVLEGLSVPFELFDEHAAKKKITKVFHLFTIFHYRFFFQEQQQNHQENCVWKLPNRF